MEHSGPSRERALADKMAQALQKFRGETAGNTGDQAEETQSGPGTDLDQVESQQRNPDAQPESQERWLLDATASGGPQVVKVGPDGVVMPDTRRGATNDEQREFAHQLMGSAPSAGMPTIDDFGAYQERVAASPGPAAPRAAPSVPQQPKGPAAPPQALAQDQVTAVGDQPQSRRETRRERRGREQKEGGQNQPQGQQRQAQVGPQETPQGARYTAAPEDAPSGAERRDAMRLREGGAAGAEGTERTAQGRYSLSDFINSAQFQPLLLRIIAQGEAGAADPISQSAADKIYRYQYEQAETIGFTEEENRRLDEATGILNEKIRRVDRVGSRITATRLEQMAPPDSVLGRFVDRIGGAAKARGIIAGERLLELAVLDESAFDRVERVLASIDARLNSASEKKRGERIKKRFEKLGLSQAELNKATEGRGLWNWFKNSFSLGKVRAEKGDTFEERFSNGIRSWFGSIEARIYLQADARLERENLARCNEDLRIVGMILAGSIDEAHRNDSLQIIRVIKNREERPSTMLNSSYRLYEALVDTGHAREHERWEKYLDTYATHTGVSKENLTEEDIAKARNPFLQRELARYNAYGDRNNGTLAPLYTKLWNEDRVNMSAARPSL